MPRNRMVLTRQKASLIRPHSEHTRHVFPVRSLELPSTAAATSCRQMYRHLQALNGSLFLLHRYTALWHCTMLLMERFLLPHCGFCRYTHLPETFRTSSHAYTKKVLL